MIFQELFSRIRYESLRRAISEKPRRGWKLVSLTVDRGGGVAELTWGASGTWRWAGAPGGAWLGPSKGGCVDRGEHIGQVRSRGDMGPRGEVERAVRPVLAALGEHPNEREAHKLAAPAPERPPARHGPL